MKQKGDDEGFVQLGFFLRIAASSKRRDEPELGDTSEASSRVFGSYGDGGAEERRAVQRKPARV